MKWISKIRTDRRESGLTLLEVLAATMIFAMVMTVLISTSTTAVHHVGVSARRLEASLLADEILADLEIQMKRGIAPEVDEDEFTRDQYAIRIFRTDLLPDPGAGDPDGMATGVAAMLGAELPEVAKHLKQYDIEVSWFEQSGPQSVTRTSFAFDWQSATIEFPELFAQAGRNGGSGLGGEDGPGGEDENEDRDFKNDPRFPPGIRPPRSGTYFGHNARLEHFRRQREAQEESGAGPGVRLYTPVWRMDGQNARRDALARERGRN